MIVDKAHSYGEQLDGARNLIEVFELVKKAVRRSTGMERGGLMLGLANLGGGLEGFVGAFYPIATNIIVMNSIPLKRIEETEPALYKPYVFHILLHEYLHTLGIIDENATRTKVYEICDNIFGPEHPVTQFAADLSGFIPKLVYPAHGWKPQVEPRIELVKGFDRSSTIPYIG
ncbi:MAG: hypothetical protein IH630_01315 [Thermoplasmata archaeon]|nr:hypothetical protein [Thermoplasmata archaeon]TFG71094.1 MAG: hypothetical protein E4H25_00160 [Methanomassiliicoccus sp.]